MLNDTFKFAFYVQLKSDELEDKFNNVIIMGKEQSPFIMEIEKIPLKNGKQSIPVIFESLPVNSDHKRVWILSNLYTDDSSRLKTNTNFICAESIPFKCFTKAINHSQRSKTWSFSKPNKTVEYSLYKQGGIIYTDKISELTATVFDAAGEWKKIGYNYFKTI
jgi:hypothetical protein